MSFWRRTGEFLLTAVVIPPIFVGAVLLAPVWALRSQLDRRAEKRRLREETEAAERNRPKVIFFGC